MTVADVVAAFALPAESRTDQRVPKTLLVEHAAATAADERQIRDGIEELRWISALKPANIAVPEYRDDVREVVEIAVLSLALRPGAKSPRLTDLIHRSIPYPVVLLAEQEGVLTVSLAEKRPARHEADRTVLEGAVAACTVDETPLAGEFLRSLPVARQPRQHLLALYRGWLACVEAWLAARITRRFAVASDPASTERRREALAAHDRLAREIDQLRSQADRETQTNRRVELNLALRRLEAERAAAVENL